MKKKKYYFFALLNKMHQFLHQEGDNILTRCMGRVQFQRRKDLPDVLLSKCETERIG